MSVQVQHRRDTNTNLEANTPAAGEFWMDNTKGELSIGNGTLAGGIRQQKKNTREILTPAQIVANTNDYNPAGLKHAAVLVVTTDAARNVTGLVAAGVVDTLDGRQITIYNAGTFNVVIQDQNVASSAANRFDLGGSDVPLGPKQSITLRYRTQGALNRWEVAASTAGAAVADGAVSARKLAASALGPYSGLINGTIVESHAANAATFAIKTLAGGDPSAIDPVYFVFRDVTAAAGDFVVRTVTAALSFTLSAGSAIGFTNGVPGKFWLTAIDNAGTVLLGAINCLSGLDIFPLTGFGVITTVAEGGAGGADLTQTMYAASAVASKAYALLGFASYETGVATVGNWASSPTRLQLYGPGVPLPGQGVQHARASVGTSGSGTTIMPFDNTIPQQTEGDQYLTKAIMPSSAAHLLQVRAQIFVSSSVSVGLQAALFQDATANAIAAGTGYIASAGSIVTIAFDYIALAAAAASTTFKVRAGPGAAATVTFNGSASAGIFGGVMNSYLKIEEIAT